VKIKIIEPYDLNKRYDVRSLTPSLGPVTVATLLRNEGHDVEVISEYVTKLNVHELNDADLVGISVATYNARKAYEIAKRIRGPVVFGGFHASLVPEECLHYGDYVIKGDGYSVTDLADFIKSGMKRDISEIANLVYRRNGQVVYNREEAKAINVVPDFGLVKGYFKLNLNRLLRIPLLVNASRGCNYRCTFCCIREVYKTIQKKDKEVIIDDLLRQTKKILLLSGFLPRVVWITDDNFFSDRNWAREVLNELATLKTGYELVLQARVDIGHDDELLDLLKKAGISRIYLGIESLRQKSLDAFDKESSIEDTRYAIKEIKSRGIEIFGLFVFGDDEFRRGDGRRVAEFAKENGFSGVLIQPLIPFPGTGLFRELKSQNRILHERWQEYNGKVVFIPKHLAPAELQQEISDCYRSVYSLRRILKALLLGKKGLRIGLFGEGIIRRIEAMKSRSYIRECLRDKKNIAIGQSAV
jgi:radical SAM superfamily enzyme YgiQ (UPF0313 family)